MKIVICVKHGGFSVSRKAAERLAELGCEDAREEITSRDASPENPLSVLGRDSYCNSIARDDARLVAVVEELGEAAASGRYAKLKVVDVPDGVEWEIDEYDGWEKIAEKHRTWA